MSCSVLSALVFTTVLLSGACRTVVTVVDGEAAASDSTDMDLGNCVSVGRTPLVCHDFETGITSASAILYGQVTAVTEPVFNGQAAMKSETHQINGYSYILDTFDPIESGTIFFRVHLYIPSGNTTGTTKVLNLSAGGNPEEEQGVDIDVSAQRSIDIYQHGNIARFVSASGMVPEGEWFCLSGSYAISDTAGATSVWINDSLAVSTTAGAAAIINGGVSEFRTGIGWTEAGQDTSVVYYDNLLVDTLPVACLD